MNLESLKSLQSRVRKATGPDRELDWLIAQAFLPPDKKFGLKKAYCTRFTTYPEGLGACVGLMMEVLPGWTRVVDASAPELGVAVELLPPDDAPPALQAAKIKGDHDLETHAHLEAIFAATIAQLEARETVG